jgi:putative tryptophan/tyrosine transport system substrate-binding protein
MRRRVFVCGLASAAAAPCLALAQAQMNIARVGFLGPAPAANYAPRVEALRAGLRELGYIEGTNLNFAFRWADAANQMPELAAELVRAGVEVILAPSSTETAAILEATKTVPVVFATHADPVGIGHVASLARPGGNATGLTMLLTEMVAKELEALKEALPNARRFGVLFTPTAPSHIPALEAAERAGRRLQVELRMVPVRSEGDLHDEFAKMAQDGVDGLLVISSSFTFSMRALLADLAIKHRLPSVFGTKDNVFAGGLLSYAPDLRDLYRQAATYVDKILRGAKPADLPVEQASRYELVINLKTAKTLGIAIPPTLLARADEVIE